MSDGIECSLEQQGERLEENVREIDLLYVIQASSDNYSNSRIVKGPRKQIATLTFPASEEYTNLGLQATQTIGPLAMELRDGIWYYTDTLNPGRYSYQLVADIDNGYLHQLTPGLSIPIIRFNG